MFAALVTATLALTNKPYWANPNIHQMGNMGFGGGLHAAISYPFIKVLDKILYEGRDMREYVKDQFDTSDVLDFGSGIGLSTANHGIDTSPEFVAMARLLHPDKTFTQANAEVYGDNDSFEFVTAFLLMHEAPSQARRIMMKNAMRVARNAAVIVDMTPRTLSPEKHNWHARGEPYLSCYMNSMRDDVASVCSDAHEFELIPGRLTAWVLPAEAIVRD